MTKSEMVEAVTTSAGITKKAGADALEAVIKLITADLKKGNNVVITGFGTFRVSKRAARTGVNSREAALYGRPVWQKTVCGFPRMSSNVKDFADCGISEGISGAVASTLALLAG